MKKKGLILFISLFFLFFLLLFLFRFPLFTAMGEYLVTEDPLEEVDLIVILQGSIPDRILHGIALYEGGYGKKLVMVRSHDFSCYQLMEEYSLSLPGHVDLNYQVAENLGVPSQDLIILPGRADSTFDEALILRKYLLQEEGDSLLLITSKYHSTRSKKIFKHVLAPEKKIISSPSPYDPFEPSSWWQERRQARSLLLEYLKLINYVLFQRRWTGEEEQSMVIPGGENNSKNIGLNTLGHSEIHACGDGSLELWLKQEKECLENEAEATGPLDYNTNHLQSMSTRV